MKTINLALLWHMHQPPYLDPGAGSTLLPWAFLHGMKDYFDMGAVAARHPRMRMNVNFTPCLLDQLEGYGAGTLADRTLAVMAKRPSSISEADREYLFRTYFGLTDRMVEPFPRYVELRALYRAAVAAGSPVPHLKPQEMTDLSVLYLLAWCGPTLAGRDDVRAIAARGRGYSDADRDALVAAARGLIMATRDIYRDLSERGIVELSTTPATHPILPLLCSSNAAAEARPDVTLPSNPFDSPDSARRQVESGLAGFERFFGFKPRGMWPAEGSVSGPALELLSRAGVEWVATDEAILAKSGGGSRTGLLHPASFGGVTIFFRDHHLSDLVGFDYSRRSAESAVDDFIRQVAARAKSARDESALVVVALDGENAWEYYPDGGYPFLDRLYAAIVDSGFITPVTFREYIDRYGKGRHLDRLAAGSWIDGNFDTWIGDPVKNLAWDYLSEARQAVAGADVEPAARERALGHLMRAEASDWFWWFGRGHSSIHEREFDFLFRRNLKAVYDVAGLTAPAYLDRPVGQGGKPAQAVMPTAFISPGITGRRDSYFKWVGAGACGHSHGSIHRLQPLIRTVRFGFDDAFLYICAEMFDGVPDPLGPGGGVRMVFGGARDVVVTMRRTPEGAVEIAATGPDGVPVPFAGATAAAIEVIEAAVPLDAVARRDRDGSLAVSFFIEAEAGDIEVERFPWDSVIDLKWNPRIFKLDGWFV